jgi:cyclase
MPRMNRRTFLVRSAAAAVSLALSPRLHSQSPPAAPEPVFAPLRDGVGTFTARGGTIGWLVNDDGVLAVDTQFPDTAAAFLAALPGRDGRRFDAVLNTHHHADHTGGNGTLAPLTESIVAHDTVPGLQRAAAERAGTLDRQHYPDHTFTTTWRTAIGDEIVHARHFGPAHTGGDIVVHFERANVVHVGDLVFNRLYPFIDRLGGSLIRGWIETLETIARTYPADARYIFGHGHPRFGVVGDRGDLLVMRDYLAGLLDFVAAARRAGRAREELLTLENLPDFEDFHQPRPNRLANNLDAAWAELEATD